MTKQLGMARTPNPPILPEQSPSVRAQILATEHWSILATRSTTQSELLVRISMFLTLVSASVVSLALIGQVTGFGDTFSTFAILLLSIVLVIGTLTMFRITNGSLEDLAHVLAMNRLRAAYVELDPGVARYLTTSPHDDQPGSVVTYNPLGGHDRTHILGSSMVFITAVNAALAGVLVAVILFAVSAPAVAIYGAGALAALSYLSAMTYWGYLRYRRAFEVFRPVSPSAEG